MPGGTIATIEALQDCNEERVNLPGVTFLAADTTQWLSSAYDRWVDKRYALSRDPKLSQLKFATVHAAIAAERRRVGAAADIENIIGDDFDAYGVDIDKLYAAGDTAATYLADTVADA